MKIRTDSSKAFMVNEGKGLEVKMNDYSPLELRTIWSKVIVATAFLFVIHFPLQTAIAAGSTPSESSVQKIPVDDCQAVQCPPSYEGPIDDKMNRCCKPIVLQQPREKESSSNKGPDKFQCISAAGCDLCCGSGSQGCTVCGCSPAKLYICNNINNINLMSPKPADRKLAGCMCCYQECIVYEGEKCVKWYRSCTWDFDCNCSKK